MTRKLALLGLWTIFLLGVLLGPIAEAGQPIAGAFRYWDKVAHFGLFGITGLVAAYSADFLRPLRGRILFGLIFALFMAVFTEAAQRLMPNRSGSLNDLLADVAGVSLALLLYALLRLR